MNVSAVTANITTIGCDVIVNAANSQLAAGGGVCGAIFRAAGHRELSAACQRLGGCAPGEAVITPAFALSRTGVRHIVHAVGPIWGNQSPEDSDALLRAAYINTMHRAETVQATSIAIPAISTGIYGFPVERAAEIAANVFTSNTFTVADVKLVALEPAKTRIYQQALDQ